MDSSLYDRAYAVSARHAFVPGRPAYGYGWVGCALETVAGNVYTGICLDYACGIGFCAEHAAIAEMLKNAETHIVRIVAVRESGEVVPPCGRCRELILQTDDRNRETLAYVTRDRAASIRELLPSYWRDNPVPTSE